MTVDLLKKKSMIVIGVPIATLRSCIVTRASDEIFPKSRAVASPISSRVYSILFKTFPIKDAFFKAPENIKG